VLSDHHSVSLPLIVSSPTSVGNTLSIVHYCGYVYHLLSIVALVTSLSLSSIHLSVLDFSSTSRLILSFGPPQLPFLGHRSLLSLSFRLGQSSFVSPVVNNSLPDDNGSTFITYQPSLSGTPIFSTVLIARATINLHSTAKEELGFIRTALRSSSISFRTPIAHLVDRDPTGKGWCDSLDAAGGWSRDCSFWWHLPWSDQIRAATLRFHHNHPDQELISINVLEFAGAIITYAGMTLYYRLHHDPSNPFPIALLYIDNVAAEIWCIKGCKRSLLGRALGRLLCALMIDNPLGLSTERISTEDNTIAERKFFASLLTSYPQLRGCARFHPSQELLSAITETLSTEKLEDPLRLNRIVLENPGSFTT